MPFAMLYILFTLYITPITPITQITLYYFILLYITLMTLMATAHAREVGMEYVTDTSVMSDMCSSASSMSWAVAS
jgi:hypothetical protein